MENPLLSLMVDLELTYAHNLEYLHAYLQEKVPVESVALVNCWVDEELARTSAAVEIAKLVEERMHDYQILLEYSYEGVRWRQNAGGWDGRLADRNVEAVAYAGAQPETPIAEAQDVGVGM